MVMQFQRLFLALELGQLIDLIESSRLPRLAALMLEHLLIGSRNSDLHSRFLRWNLLIENSVLPTLSGTRDFRETQPRDRGGRFIVKSFVTSCRSAADEIATVRNLPSGYVLASS